MVKMLKNEREHFDYKKIFYKSRYQESKQSFNHVQNNRNIISESNEELKSQDNQISNHIVEVQNNRNIINEIEELILQNNQFSKQFNNLSLEKAENRTNINTEVDIIKEEFNEKMIIN